MVLGVVGIVARGGATSREWRWPVGKEDRGFASMDKARLKIVSSKGGKEAHRVGRGRQWTAAQARAAGKLGGKASHGGRGRDYVRASTSVKGSR